MFYTKRYLHTTLKIFINLKLCVILLCVLYYFPSIFQEYQVVISDLQRKLSAKDVLIERLEDKVAKVDLVCYSCYTNCPFL